jgi:hypothetical protein
LRWRLVFCKLETTACRGICKFMIVKPHDH